VLLGSLFLHWYTTGLDVGGPLPIAGEVSSTGWRAFGWQDIALTGVAVAAASTTAVSFFVGGRVLMVVVAVLGLCALGLTIAAVASPPSGVTLEDLEFAPDDLSISRDVGAYLALVGSVVLAAAGVTGALLTQSKRCPACAKSVPETADVCHRCGHPFGAQQAPGAPAGPPSLPPAGWYSDANGQVRWWDGQRWTEHLRQP
jgi:hypothetical protein